MDTSDLQQSPGGSEVTPAPAGERQWFARFGAVAAVVVGVCTVVVGPPPDRSTFALALGLLVVGTALWLFALQPDVRSQWVLTVCLAGFGLCGAGLDLLQPDGPGLVLVYLAMAALAFRLPPRWAVAGGVPVLLAGAVVESVNAARPLPAVVNIVLGACLLLGVSSFASVSREAVVRAERLLAEEAARREAWERAAALAERARLTREIHDVLTHTLSGLAVQLEGTRLLAIRTEADERLTAEVATAHRLVSEGLVDARHAISALRGDPQPTPGQLPRLVEDARRNGSTRIVLETVGEPRHLSPEAGRTVYRTVQEALTNVTKHAGAGAQVTVRLTYATDEVVVEVVDSGGRGASGGKPADGLGLTGMAERAALLGGFLEAQPRVDGFRVRLSIPAP